MPAATLDDLRCRWRRCPSAGPFDDSKALYEHIVRKHCKEPAMPFLCRWDGCAASVSTPGEVNRTRHVITHTSYRPYVCKQPGCTGRSYARKAALVHHHLSEHHDMGKEDGPDDTEDDSGEDSGSPSSGEVDSDDGGSSNSSEAGSDSESSRVSARLECLWGACAASFPADYAGAAELWEHLSVRHYPAQRCRWGACRMALPRVTYKSHVRTHLPEWYRPFVCDICGRAFARAAALKRHQDVTHSSALGKRARKRSARDRSARKKRKPSSEGSRSSIASSSARGSTIAVDELQLQETTDELRATACASEGPDKAAEASTSGELENGSMIAALLEQRLLSAETKIQQLEAQVQELARGKGAALAEISEDDQLLDPALFAYED